MFFYVIFVIIGILCIKSNNFEIADSLFILLSTLCEIFILNYIILNIKNIFLKYTCGCIVGIIYIAQIVALYISDDFISVLAFQNIQYVTLVINFKMLIFACVSLLLLLGGLAADFYFFRRNQKENISTTVIGGALSFFLVAYLFNYPAPVISCLHNAFCAIRNENQFVSQNSLEIKKHVYKSSIPFCSSVKKPNVLIFFMEGTSKRCLTEFNDRFPGLTPNILRFISESCDVKNYYSHTAATFRGIEGALCSSFPYFGGNGGWMQRHDELKLHTYHSVIPLLKKNGYSTVFFNPHGHTDALKYMLNAIGFEKVYTGESLCQEFLGVQYGSITRHNAIPDRELFKSIKGFLESSPQTPFFVGAYNIETHAFVDTKENGIKYGNGKNISLNTIHNYDTCFGEFWNWFKTSPYSSNTILILTADHSHFPEPPFCEVAGETFQRVFVDEIPFYIHAPFMDLPKKFSSGGLLSSLDLAPTICHLLSINEPNYFMGKSIFERGAEDFVVNWQGEGFLVTRKGIFHEKRIPETYRKRFEFELKKITYSQGRDKE